MNDPIDIGLIGAGRMGGAMAANLLAKGHALAVWDLDSGRLTNLAEAGARIASTWRRGWLGGLGADHLLPVDRGTGRHGRSTPECTGPARRGSALTVLRDSTLPLADKQRAQAALAAAGIEMLDCPLIGAHAGQASHADRACQRRSCGLRSLSAGAAAVSMQQHYIGAFGESTKLKLIVNHLVGIHQLWWPRHCNWRTWPASISRWSIM